MNRIDLSKPENVATAKEIIILNFSLFGCIGLGLLGWGLFTFYNHQAGVKSQPQATEKLNNKVTTQTQQTPIVIVKKPVVIEEGSKAHFCLKNNGGSDCLKRDRFAHYKITPPKLQKTYEDYLVQYGIRESGYCGRYFNGRPNC
ncbi:MAG: hypothetical protein ACRC78_12630 [Planktothrix sp.]